jgi:phospholipase A1
MSHRTTAPALLICLLSCSIPALAEVGQVPLQSCLDLQDRGESDQALACYKRAARSQQALGEAKAPNPPSVAVGGRTLAEEWTPLDGVPLKLYKQTYFLVTHTANPNNAPTSPNPLNQVPFSYPLIHKEVKFQISIKSDLYKFSDRHVLWAAYSQQSFWQIFDTKHSNPFRESNYEPELIYSFRPEDMGSKSSVVASFFNAGLVHQSNGQSLPRSRGWNRLYVQAGLEHDFGNEQRLAILPRYWKRLGGGGIDDDNPDILHYLGHGDVELRYYHGHGMLSAIVRSRSQQLDLAVPLRALNVKNANLHLQYFHGYGESLIDYNQGHTTLGIGLSMPFEDSY